MYTNPISLLGIVPNRNNDNVPVIPITHVFRKVSADITFKVHRIKELGREIAVRTL